MPKTQEEAMERRKELRMRRWCIWGLMLMAGFLVISAAIFVWHEHHRSAGLREVQAAAGALAAEVAAKSVDLAVNAGAVSHSEGAHWVRKLLEEVPPTVYDRALFIEAFRKKYGKCVYFLNAQGGPAAFTPNGNPAPPPCVPWIVAVDAAVEELRVLDSRLQREDLCPDEAKEEIARRRANIEKLLGGKPPGPPAEDAPPWEDDWEEEEDSYPYEFKRH